MAFIDPDIAAGIRSWRLWTTWAWIDTRQRYRRSVLGPFWITLSLGAWIVGLGVVFSILFGMKLEDFLPYVCAGMILWRLIFNMVNGGCEVFIGNEQIIKQINLPLSYYVFRLIAKQFIFFFHHIIIFVLIAAIFGVVPSSALMLAVPGLALLFVNGVWIALLLGMICARFRDVPQIVETVLQVTFFVTPVFWMPAQLGSKGVIAYMNPVYHFIEIVRQPLLGQPPTELNWIVVLVTTIVGAGVTAILFRRFSRRVAYWL